jgi:hypothetical protein
VETASPVSTNLSVARPSHSPHALKHGPERAYVSRSPTSVSSAEVLNYL